MDVYLGTRALVVYPSAEHLRCWTLNGLDQGLQEFEHWLTDAPAKQAMRVWLSGGLCRPFLVPAVDGVKSTTEMLRIAASMAPRLTGLEGECEIWLDPVRVQHAGASASRACVAVQSDVLSRLCATVARRGAHRLLSLRPWWGDALRSVLQREPDKSAVAVHDCDSLTVLVGQSGLFEIATTLTPVVDREAADAALSRILMTSGAASDNHVLARLDPQRTESSPRVPSDIALGSLVEFSR